MDIQDETRINHLQEYKPEHLPSAPQNRLIIGAHYIIESEYT